MVNYNPKWNKRGAIGTVKLVGDKGTINSIQFIDKDGFDAAQAILIANRDRWHDSDQFRGQTLKIVVETTEWVK